MVNTPGTLLAAHQYTSAAYTSAAAARAAYEAAQPATPSLAKKYPLLAVVGDMVSNPDLDHRDQEEGTTIAARFKDVSDMVVQSNCTYLTVLGDNVYEHGQLADYAWAYHNTFGRVNEKCLPMPGNHEYMGPNSSTGADYYTYFGNLAGPSGLGYYAVNIGPWRFYSLNSCTTALWNSASPQRMWLAADLAANQGKPKIAGWHHPRWTDGGSPGISDDSNYEQIWEICYAEDFQIVLVGHDHNYQRWDKIKANGAGNNPATVADGITQFVVGCGGNNFFNLKDPPRPGETNLNLTGGPSSMPNRSSYGFDRMFGVLFLRLGPTTWDWLFKGIDGNVYDSGTRSIYYR